MAPSPALVVFPWVSAFTETTSRWWSTVFTTSSELGDESVVALRPKKLIHNTILEMCNTYFDSFWRQTFNEIIQMPKLEDHSWHSKTRNKQWYLQFQRMCRSSNKVNICNNLNGPWYLKIWKSIFLQSWNPRFCCKAETHDFNGRKTTLDNVRNTCLYLWHHSWVIIWLLPINS